MMRLFLACLLAAAVCAEKVRYDGYSVLEVTPKTEAHNTMFLELQAETDMDFWLDPTPMLTPVHILVSPQNYQGLRAAFELAGMDVGIHIENIQEQFDEEDRRLSGKKFMAYDYNDYNPLDTIFEELEALAADCPSGFSCSVNTIGSSVEGRPMRVLEVNTGRSEGRSLYVDSMIHAREWLAGATTMNVFNRLIREYGSNTEATEIVNRYDNIYFIPVVNPDGYEYTWTNNRNWRKNRRVGSSCFGVDLNRNYDANWSVIGSSPNECSDTFHGPSAASEPETQAVQNFLNSRTGDNIEVLLTFHTYGQYWLIPYGDCSLPSNWADTSRVGAAASRAIESVYNTRWLDGNSCAVLYATSGSTADFGQETIGIPYSYTPELRGGSFSPPASAITPSFNEIWAGLVAMFNAID